MSAFYLSEIHIYPIKSLGGMSVQYATLEEKGLQYDRRWMLIDSEGTFVSQRKHFELALLQVGINDDQLVVTHKSRPGQAVSFGLQEMTGADIMVTVWDSTCSGKEVNTSVSEWFSDILQMPVRLVVMPADEKRLVDPRYALDNEIVSFADGYPCLLIGQSSLDGLNEKLDAPILMDRFRPNFVFTGGHPHVEDSFATFDLGGISFSAVKPCARCVLITVDQQTGNKGQEPLKTLAGYRTINKKVMFGQNLLHQGTGTIHVGDELTIKGWKPSI